MKTDGSFGLCVALGLIIATVHGKGSSALLWILAMLIGVPVFYALVVARSAVSDFGKWALTGAFILVVTALFLLW